MELFHCVLMEFLHSLPAHSSVLVHGMKEASCNKGKFPLHTSRLARCRQGKQVSTLLGILILT